MNSGSQTRKNPKENPDEKKQDYFKEHDNFIRFDLFLTKMKKGAVFLLSVILLFNIFFLIQGQEETNERSIEEDSENFFDKIANFFKNLFKSGGNADKNTVDEPERVSEKSKDMISETDDTQVESVEETLLFSWKKDDDSRIVDGSVPFVHKLNDGRIRLYYCNAKGILSSVSEEGLTFTKEQGVRISPGTGFESYVCDPTIVNLQNGKMRLYYKGTNSQNPGQGQSIHKIYSAISSDGLTFQKEGLRIDSETNGDNGWASVPDAIVLPDGKVRIYYVTASDMEHGIGSAISSDGLDFVKEPGLRIPDLVDPALVRIKDRYVLFAASIDERFAQVPKGIYYATSSDGLDFGEPIAVFQEEDVYDPSVLKIDDGTVRVFYGKVAPPQLPAVESQTGKIAE